MKKLAALVVALASCTPMLPPEVEQGRLYVRPVKTPIGRPEQDCGWAALVNETDGTFRYMGLSGVPSHSVKHGGDWEPMMARAPLIEYELKPRERVEFPIKISPREAVEAVRITLRRAGSGESFDVECEMRP